eukprot:TRINITY_DN9691_c0_g1_i1.p1 TRINITY_DN9691_c0_g1~~TRINITY_DN9691_c0_g1_i1.p1  ORF type:complete len:517 (+),score=149.42 TRINITY_DN9691_c0_g1_i1:88-1638(+)
MSAGQSRCCDYDIAALPSWMNVHDQWELVKDFMRDEMFRAPVLALWLAVAGGSLHAPVTPFFYLELGATYETIGWYSSIAACGALTAPMQGWYADKHGTYWMMLLGLGGCAVGCLVRGLSTSLMQIVVGILAVSLGGDNLVSMILAHIIKNTPVAKRGQAVAGFLAQIGACSLLGKSLFPLVDLMITSATETDMARYRWHMSICIVFCFLGISGVVQSKAVILSNRPLPKSPPDEDDETAHLPLDDVETGGADLQNPHAGDADNAETSRVQASSQTGIMLCLTALCCRMTCATVLLIVWPLFLRDRFDWTPREYSYCLVASSVTNTVAVSYAARLTDALGTRTAATLCVGIALVFGWTAFYVPIHLSDVRGQVLHCLTLIFAIAAIEVMDFVVRLAASHHSLRSSQGRTFGSLVAASSLGAVVGSYCGATLYQTHAESSSGGVYPMLLITAALLVLLGAMHLSERSALLLRVAMRPAAEADADAPSYSPRKDWCKSFLRLTTLSQRRSASGATEGV